MKVKNQIKKFVKQYYWSYKMFSCVKTLVLKIQNMGGVNIVNKGIGKFVVDSVGKNNRIIVSKGTMINRTKFRIRGNNNTIEFDENCRVGPKCSFWMEGNNISIKIGASTSFTHTVHFCAQEDNSAITVGEDCMFANTIIVRTSDSHAIYDMNSDERINHPKSVYIGNHVWIAPGAKIMKGSVIEDGAIIGSNSVVTKVISANSLAVGMPAKVVRENIKWTREKLF